MVPDWAEKYIRIPFAEKGESFEGANCWTLARLVLRTEFKIELPDYETDYAHSTDTQAIEKIRSRGVAYWCEQEKQWQQVERAQCGDLLFFRVWGELHCGICLDDTWMLHVVKGANACLARYTDFIWKHRRTETYRYCGRDRSPG